MKYAFIFLLVSCELLAAALPAISKDIDSTIHVRDTLTGIYQSPISHDGSLSKRLLTAASLSLVIPGTGQWYTGHYVKGSLILAAGTVLGILGYNQNQTLSINKTESAKALDSFRVNSNVIVVRIDTIITGSGNSVSSDTTFRGTHFNMEYQFARFEEQKARNQVYQSMVWAAGLYYYAFLDAVKSTGFFDDGNARNPVKATYLAAIPFLGLGQLYNGELSKAGLITMAQLSLAYMAYNNNTLMRICEKNIAKIERPGTRENRDADASFLLDQWNSARDDAFKGRNTYIWYSLALYLYSIVDAVVDAHLHDLSAKMRFEPDLSPYQGRVGVNLRLNF